MYGLNLDYIRKLGCSNYFENPVARSAVAGMALAHYRARQTTRYGKTIYIKK